MKSLIGILTVTAILTGALCGCDRKGEPKAPKSETADSGKRKAGSHSVAPSRSKSARQLITDRAKQLYGRNVDVTIDGGYAGGAYTVTISDHEKFHTYTYAVEVNEKAQKVTAWQLTAAD